MLWKLLKFLVFDSICCVLLSLLKSHILCHGLWKALYIWYIHKDLVGPPLTIPHLFGSLHSWFIVIPAIAFVSTPQWPVKVVTWAWLTSFQICPHHSFLSRSQALAVISSSIMWPLWCDHYHVTMWPCDHYDVTMTIWPWASWCWSHWPWGASLSGPRSTLLPGQARQLTLNCVLELWRLTRWEDKRGKCSENIKNDQTDSWSFILQEIKNGR